MNGDWAARERAKRWFETHGVSVSDWAARNGFDRELVYAVLNGRTKGRRGVSHRIAVALGIKAVPDEGQAIGPGRFGPGRPVAVDEVASSNESPGGRNET